VVVKWKVTWAGIPAGKIHQRETLAVLFVGQHVAIALIGARIVELRVRLGGIAERRMRGHVLDLLAADVNDPAIA